MKHLIILSDGTELFSGGETENAIQSVEITQTVNSGEELTLGSVCAGMVEATLIAPGGGLSLAAGEEITLYRVREDARTKIGVYILEKPTKVSANSMKLMGFDYTQKLDKDLSLWLAQLDAWPYTLLDLANQVCAQCGVTLENEEIPNGDFYVQKFSADGVTGRDLMRWIGQVSGRFCTATAEGSLKFDWYREKTGVIGRDYWYYQNGLKFEDYAVGRIARVQIRQTAEDVGTSYPDTTGNTYVIEGNPLLSATDGEVLLPVAQKLYEQLQDVTYTPARVTVSADFGISAGDILQVTDANGAAFPMYVMKKKYSAGRDTLECTGSARRESTMAVNNQTIRQYMGKVLNLSMTVDGIRAENKDMQGNLAALQLDLSGIEGRVEQSTKDADTLKSDIADLELSAQELRLSFQDIVENGTAKVTTSTGYTFDQDGLQIRKDGQQMENRLDHEGMVVSRSGTAILKATAAGVEATDVRVNNYLMVGNCRFEDYTNGTDSKRTACFFIG